MMERRKIKIQCNLTEEISDIIGMIAKHLEVDVLIVPAKWKEISIADINKSEFDDCKKNYTNKI